MSQINITSVNSMSVHEYICFLQSLITEKKHNTYDEILILMQYWIEKMHRSEKLNADDQCNIMHMTGGALSMLLFDCKELKLDEITLESIFNNLYSKIVFLERDDYVISELTIEQIHDILVSLQVEFEQIFVMDEQGFYSHINVENICFFLMAQLGKWVSHYFKEETVNEDEDIETMNQASTCKPEIDMPNAALRGLVDIDNDQFCTIRIDELVFLMNALHSMLTLNMLLLNSIKVHAKKDLIELNAHHKEASAEVFFTHSMT